MPRRVTRGERLSADDWIRAAFEALLEEGHTGLGIARVARRLGVTRGSFYWHFRDRKQLQEQMLRHWQGMLQEAVAAAEVAGQGSSKFRALPRVLSARKLPDLDAAIRAWSQSDASVAKQVARADQLRIRRVESLLRATGLDDATASRRAPLLLWAHIGSIGAEAKQREAALGELVGLLAAPPRSKLLAAPPRPKTESATTRTRQRARV